MIVQLIYISVSHGITVDKIENFFESARQRNAEIDLASILLITDTCYIHCLEGSRADVSKKYNKISQDARHSGCTILRFNDIAHREFSDFNAEFVRLSEFDNIEIDTICPDGTIDPHSITPLMAVTLIRRVAAHIRADRLATHHNK